MPTQGTYEIELDESTLPEGIKLAEGQEKQIEALYVEVDLKTKEMKI